MANSYFSIRGTDHNDSSWGFFHQELKQTVTSAINLCHPFYMCFLPSLFSFFPFSHFSLPLSEWNHHHASFYHLPNPHTKLAFLMTAFMFQSFPGTLKKKNVAVLVPSPSRITVTNIVEPLWGLCIISFRNNIFIFLPRVFWHLISLTGSLVLMWALKTLYHMRREDILKLDGHSFTPAMPM